jgi:hypothetical protein
VFYVKPAGDDKLKEGDLTPEGIFSIKDMHPSLGQSFCGWIIQTSSNPWRGNISKPKQDGITIGWS